MTPRRLLAWLALAERRKRIEDYNRFVLIQTAMHADKKGTDRFLADLIAED